MPRNFDFHSVSRDKNFNAKFAHFQDRRKAIFCQQYTQGPTSVLVTDRRSEDRSARPIERQIANYVPAAERWADEN